MNLMLPFRRQRRSARLLACASHSVFESLESRRLMAAQFVPSGDAPLPRNLTAEELEWIKNNPQEGGPSIAAPSTPPSGPIDPVAEYDPMEGLVISWMSFTAIQRDIAKRVTDAGGRMYIGVTSASVQTSAT